MARGDDARKRLAEGRERVGGKRGPNGRPLCCWCGQEVPKGRRAWCGPECIDQYRRETDAGYLKQKVWERDHGICAQCGLDMAKLRAWYRRQGRRGRWRNREAERYFLTRMGLYDASRVIWWDADHIVAVVEGGTNDLANIRTLCPRCHKAETARLRRRLAVKKRNQGSLLET
ncbi:MAG: HNH endonuclease [Gammaproteobacteria bacterium]|nr:HNH endonuclease [Gammaproteobacteria bacterium]